MSLKVIRDVSVVECGWLDSDVKSGTIVYTYGGCTYGCVSPNGVAVTKVDGETPFFELPSDSVETLGGANE